MLNIQMIDEITESYYKFLNFHQEHFPNINGLEKLFYGTGKLINNNYEKPINFTVQSYVQAIMKQIEQDNGLYMHQKEISATTEVFGKNAQRISVYEYFDSEDNELPKRGVNFIQYILTEEGWKIVSMIWNDEQDGLSIPEAYLL